MPPQITYRNAVAYVNRLGKLAIKMQFDMDKKLLWTIKELPGRAYNEKGKYWTCPLTRDVVKQLLDLGFTLDDKLKEFLSPQDVFKPTLIDIPGLHGTLFPYQAEGVAYFEWRNGRAICGDEMGLGKTIQAIAWLQLRRDLRPAIIVVQAALKYMWEEQCKQWMHHPHVQVLAGRDSTQIITDDILIVNYEILTYWVQRLQSLKPKALIVDEIQSIMHGKSLQTKATLKIGRKCACVIGLSGTPILNRPMEGYNAIKLIDSTLVPATKLAYGLEFCGAYNNGSWNYSGATNIDKLHTILNSVMIRRLKKDVMPQLPKKLRTVIPLEITNRKEYNEAEEDFIAWVKEHRGESAARRANRAEALTKLEVLKQLAVKGKLKAACGWINDFLDNDQKLITFTTHRSTLDYIMHTFHKGSIALVGGLGSEKTNDLVHQFQTDRSIRLLVGMLDSRGRPAGVGHTLTAASSTSFIEFPWSPGICNQAEDRVHRIGQEASCVYAYYLLANDTVECKIAKLIDKKRNVVDQVLDGIAPEESSLLIELLNAYEGGQI